MKQVEVITEFEVEHPMEELLDIEPGTTIVERKEIKTEIATIELYDTKDSEIEEQLQQIADAAMTAFNDQQDSSFAMDPKFKARNQEVAVQYLNTALAAIKEKSMLKQHKDRVHAVEKEADKPKTVNNNLIVDRNILLKMLSAQTGAE